MSSGITFCLHSWSITPCPWWWSSSSTISLGLFGIVNLVAIEVGNLPGWVQLLLIFVLRDFMQWNIHRMYHHVGWMWEFHKVHHSTRQMGFGALLRFHWMESVLYRTLEYIPLAMIGFGITDFFIVHIFTLGNRSAGPCQPKNPIGTLSVCVQRTANAPVAPCQRPSALPIRTASTYGITLSIWDFLFRTNYWPSDDENLPVGLPDQEKFPEDFVGQTVRPFQNIFRRKRVAVIPVKEKVIGVKTPVD
jgi:sterol desaturase/sphingolipid hydroxylase (fatty acid hydroxylase superfamily)